MTSPGISVVIPAYNAARYLREAIDSALNQTTKPRQVIVVDDGSADDTLQIARSYRERIVTLTQANAGTSAARNRGMEQADQSMIAFLDADDRWTPDKLERQLQAFSDRPEAMLCICRVRNFWSPEVPEAARGPMSLEPECRRGQATTWLARREVFETLGRFSLAASFRFSEGSELYTRIEGAGLGIVTIDDVLVERRLHTANKTTNSQAHLDGIMALMQKRLQLRRSAK